MSSCLADNFEVYFALDISGKSAWKKILSVKKWWAGAYPSIEIVSDRERSSRGHQSPTKG